MSKRTPRKTSVKSVSIRTFPSISTIHDADERTPCKSHPKFYLDLYCTFCQKPVCEKCKVITHVRHVADVKGNDVLRSAAKIRRRHLVRLLDSKQKAIVPSLKNSILQIIDSKSKLQSQVASGIDQYQDFTNIHRDKLSIPEEDWIEDVHYRAIKFYNLMDEKVDFLKRQLHHVTSIFTNLYEELKHSNNPQLLLIFGVLRSRLESLHEPRWPREEVTITFNMETVPKFGAVLVQKEEDRYVDKNCSLEFNQEIVEPTIYSRIYDTTIPVPKRVIEDEHAKISLASADEMFVSFGEYIVVYPLDSRRYAKTSRNIGFNRIITVRQNIIDIACDQEGGLYFATQNSIKRLPREANKIQNRFSLRETPSAICMPSTTEESSAIFVGFHDAGKIIKYSTKGEILTSLTHPDPKMIYRPRHLTINNVGDIFFSDDISNITILDTNGIWKGSIARDIKTSSPARLLRPTGIACSNQRHVFIIDANAVTSVHIFSEDGKYLQTAVFKNLQDAYVLTIDKTEDVWVAFKDGRIRIYRPDFILCDGQFR